MKKTVFTIMILTILSQILGFGRDLTLAFYYGTSNTSDVYLVVLTITSVLIGFIGKGISTGYIPLYSQIENTNGTKAAIGFTNNLINLLLILSGFIFVIGFIFSQEIVKVFATGFDNKTLTLAVTFMRIMLASIFLTVLI